MKIARRAMRRGVSAWGSVAQRPSLVGVETPPPRSEHDTPPRTASPLSISTVVLPPRGYRSRAFARNFHPHHQLHLASYRAKLARFVYTCSLLFEDSLVTVWWCARAHAISPRSVMRFRSPFGSTRVEVRVASAFAPAPALNHAATAFAFVFAFAFAFASLLKPPPPRLGNDRRAKGDCPSQCRSRAVIGCTAFWNSFSLRPFKLLLAQSLSYFFRRMCSIQKTDSVSRFFAHGNEF